MPYSYYAARNLVDVCRKLLTKAGVFDGSVCGEDLLLLEKALELIEAPKSPLHPMIQQAVADLPRTGRVHLGGEMEFQVNQGARVAYLEAAKIAEACGYLVGLRNGCRLSVVGGDICGEYVLEWFNGADRLTKIEYWTSETWYQSEPAEAIH